MGDFFETDTSEMFTALLGFFGIVVGMLVLFGGLMLLMNYIDNAPQRRLRRQAKAKTKALANDPVTPKCTCGHWFNNHKLASPHACANYECDCQMYMGPDPTISGMWTARPD